MWSRSKLCYSRYCEQGFPHSYFLKLYTSRYQWFFGRLCQLCHCLPPSKMLFFGGIFYPTGALKRLKWVNDDAWAHSSSCYFAPGVCVTSLKQVLPLDSESIWLISVQFNFHLAPLWSVSIPLRFCGRCVCFTSESHLSADTVRQLQTDSLQYEPPETRGPFP